MESGKGNDGASGEPAERRRTFAESNPAAWGDLLDFLIELAIADVEKEEAAQRSTADQPAPPRNRDEWR